jgi:hypothetical protein
MAQMLDYAPPPAPSPWSRYFAATLGACVHGLEAVIATGVLSTVAMRWLQAREGRPVLTGPPNGRYYELIIAVIPSLLATVLLAVAWGRAVRRSAPADRLPVAVVAAVPLAGLWCAIMLWIIRNGEIAFP